MVQWKSPIPQYIHLIWIGTRSPPDYLRLFIKTFIRNFPNFKIKVWRNKDLSRAIHNLRLYSKSQETSRQTNERQ